MRKLFKKEMIIGFLIGIVVTTSIAVYASINANTVDYTNNKKVSNALNELYSNMSNETKTITQNGQQVLEKYYKNLNVNVENNQLQQITLYDTKQLIGNITTPYTFNGEINLGLIIISSSNNENNFERYVAEIDELSSGTYEIIDNTALTTAYSSNAGHRCKIYLVHNINANSTVNFVTRYTSIVQILKIN